MVKSKILNFNLFWISILLIVLNSPQTVLADKLEDQILIFSKLAAKHEEENPTMTHDFLPPNLKDSSPFVCTDGTDPKKMTYIGYMKAFSKGPCSPVIIIPGITGSKLEAEVTCEVLREKNPDLFNACGWKDCENKGKSPKSTYMVWIPKPTSTSF